MNRCLANRDRGFVGGLLDRYCLVDISVGYRVR